MNNFIRRKKNQIIIFLGYAISEKLAVKIYKIIFNTKKFKYYKLAKLVLIIIARKGINKKIISEIDIEGKKLETNILDYSIFTKSLGLGVDPLLPILRAGGDVFIDAGCHVGYYSLIAANYFKNIYSIDASKSRINECKLNSKKLNFNEKINTFNYALGDYDSPDLITLYENPFNSGGSFTSSELINNNWSKEEIRCTTLDSLLLEKLIKLKNCKRLILKIDVEGFDLKVLKGSSKILYKFRPIVVIESRPQNEIINKIYKILPESYRIKTSSSFLFKSINNAIDADLVCLPFEI